VYVIVEKVIFIIEHLYRYIHTLIHIKIETQTHNRKEEEEEEKKK